MPFRPNPHLPEGFQDDIKKTKKMKEVERLRNARLARMINDSDQDLPGPARRAMKREGIYMLLLLLLLLFTHTVQCINEIIF